MLSWCEEVLERRPQPEAPCASSDLVWFLAQAIQCHVPDISAALNTHSLPAFSSHWNETYRAQGRPRHALPTKAHS